MCTLVSCFFFFNDTATTEIYTLSLHDALPILVTDFGFTQQQVFPYIPEKTSAPAKYRDPATGATWTGRGKPPNWIKDQDRDDFLIESKPEAAQGPFLAEMAAAAARN